MSTRALTPLWRPYIAEGVRSEQQRAGRGLTKLPSPRAMGMPRCPSLRKIFLLPPSSGRGNGAGYSSQEAGAVGVCRAENTPSKKSLTTGMHASRARLMLGRGA
jgi:hypothetical protein